jgi:hypothetical protein
VTDSVVEVCAWAIQAIDCASGVVAHLELYAACTSAVIGGSYAIGGGFCI